MPYFSIIIPTYNRATFVAKTITSLLSQTFDDYEIIVVDDGSTDDTENIVRSINSPKLTYYKKENGERGIARNFGARLAKGNYVNFFDSDDLAYPNHLQTAFDFLKEYNTPEIIHLNYDQVDLNSRKSRAGISHKGDISSKIITENFLSCNGVFLRKDIADKYPFPEDRRMAVSEDWALWLTLGARYPIWHSNTVSSSVIIHEQRSILDWNPDKVITRDNLLIQCLLSDKEFCKKYRKNIPRFIADRYTFFMLLLALNKRKLETLNYALKALKNDVTVMYRKRFIASLVKVVKL